MPSSKLLNWVTLVFGQACQHTRAEECKDVPVNVPFQLLVGILEVNLFNFVSICNYLLTSIDSCFDTYIWKDVAGEG